jgi:hypothetical protein
LRGQLQAALGTYATVLEYVSQSEGGHPYPGWWASFHHVEQDCGCRACQSAVDGRDHYLGFHLRDAMVAATDYRRAHPDE